MKQIVLIGFATKENIDIFINRGFYKEISNDTKVFFKIVDGMCGVLAQAKPVGEIINIDTYLTKEQQEVFQKEENYYLTEEEQKEMLEGNIEYAFDKILERID